MNYKRVYESIIQRRLENPLSEGEYVEKHHIVPRSLGGDDNETNLIRLTAREHFICHALLAEMYEEGTNEWYKLNHAFMMMKAESEDHGGHRYINSRLYELKRKDFSKVMSYVQSGNGNSQYGKVWICNLLLEQSIRVDKSELDFYLETDWMLGRVLDFEKFKKHKPNKRELDFMNYKTENGYVINKQRRNKIKNIFNIDLDNEFHTSFEKLRALLYKLYVVENKSPNCIARMFKTNRNTITSNLELCGIYLRTWKESKLVEDSDNILVEQYDRSGKLLNVWTNATYAALNLGIKRRYIIKCCNHMQYTFNGYIWKYKT